jgi:hypothetical protein
MCVPCPVSYFCSSGAPVLCPAGSFCPLSSVNATPCVAGTFSPSTGASACSPCPAGSFTPSAGSRACEACPAGYVCPSLGAADPRIAPAGTCGVGFYCPAGSSVPISCASVVCPEGLSNGPAFITDTATCPGHCCSGAPGKLSGCG